MRSRGDGENNDDDNESGERQRSLRRGLRHGSVDSFFEQPENVWRRTGQFRALSSQCPKGLDPVGVRRLQAGQLQPHRGSNRTAFPSQGGSGLPVESALDANQDLVSTGG
jgi:hypothetical protein